MGQYVNKLIKYLKSNENAGNQRIKLAEYDGTTFKSGELELEADDMFIPDYLKNGYVTNVSGDTVERIPGLKAGDMVAIVRMSDELYLILGRMVEM